MSSKVSKQKGGSSSGKKKMASGGAPNANGYGKRATYASSIGSSVALDQAKQRATAKKKVAVTKPSSTKKSSSNKTKAMTDDQFDSYMKKKYGTLNKSEFTEKTKGSTIIADTENPSNVGKKRSSSGRITSEPITMVKNNIVKIPSTSPEIKRTAMVPLGKKGGAMSKMKKMSYRKGGSKKC